MQRTLGNSTVSGLNVSDAPFSQGPRITEASLTTYVDPFVYHLVDTAINCFAVIALSAFGVFGNIVNIIVFYHQGVKDDSMNVLLLSLSASDMLFSLTLFVRRLPCPVSHISPAMGVTVETMSMMVLAANRMMLATSLNLVGVVAVERAVAVFFPFKVGRIFTPARTKVLVVAIYLYQVVTTGPFFYLFTFDWTFDPRYNATVATLALTNFYKDNYDLLNFVGLILINNLNCTLNMIIVLISGTAISIKLVQSQKSRQKLTTKDLGYDVKVVKMLLIICSICFVVFLPSGVIDTYSYFVPNFVFLNKLYALLQFICDFLYAINSSVNFLIYLNMSSNYAAAFASIRASLFAKSTDGNLKKHIKTADR